MTNELTAADGATKMRLEHYIALRVKQQRISRGYKISDVGKIARISPGMISKIENAQVSPSLETLGRLCDALNLPVSELFNEYDEKGGGAQHTKAGQGLEVVRTGTELGHAYQLLGFTKGPRKLYDPFLVTMDDASEIFPNFSHPGHEFLFLIKGRLTYRHGSQLYDMAPGDSLAFDGRVPHGPEHLSEVPIELLSIIHYDESDT